MHAVRFSSVFRPATRATVANPSGSGTSNGWRFWQGLVSDEAVDRERQCIGIGGPIGENQATYSRLWLACGARSVRPLPILSFANSSMGDPWAQWPVRLLSHTVRRQPAPDSVPGPCLETLHNPVLIEGGQVRASGTLELYSMRLGRGSPSWGGEAAAWSRREGQVVSPAGFEPALPP